MGEVKQIIYFRESAIQSIIADTYAMASIGGLAWFNYNFIGGSYFVNFIIFVLVGCVMLSRSSVKRKVFTRYKDLLEYIQEELKKETHHD